MDHKLSVWQLCFNKCIRDDSPQYCILCISWHLHRADLIMCCNLPAPPSSNPLTWSVYPSLSALIIWGEIEKEEYLAWTLAPWKSSMSTLSSYLCFRVRIWMVSRPVVRYRCWDGHWQASVLLWRKLKVFIIFIPYHGPQILTQPVLSSCMAKAPLVLIPTPVEVHSAIHPSLEHLCFKYETGSKQVWWLTHCNNALYLCIM